MATASVFPAEVSAPGWVSSEAGISAGADILGLRLAAQVIGGRLLNGLTSNAPRVRYVSLRTWLLERYIHAPTPQPDTLHGFINFAVAGEAAFVLANLLPERLMRQLVGADWARERLNRGDAVFALKSLWVQKAVQIYAGLSDELRLTENRENRAPGLGRERGLPLAAAVQESLGATAVGRRLVPGQVPAAFELEEIREFAAVASADHVPERERAALLDAVLPERPHPDERSRIATYALLLELSRLHGRAPSEADLWTEAARGSDRVSAPLADVLDGWLHYLIRDTVAVTAEAVLQGVVDTLRRVAGEYGSAEDLAVAGALAGEWSTHAEALGEMGLLAGGEEPAALRFRDLEARVADRCGSLRPTGAHATLMRWSGELDEWTLIRAANRSGSYATSLLLVGWLLAERRVGEAVRARDAAVEELSYRGFERFGLAQVVLPALARWRAADAPMAQVLGEIAFLVVDQHLRVAWARFAAETLDVAVLYREGSVWTHRKGFGGGRTAPRVDLACGWLAQLGLTGDGGLTAEGDRALERARSALKVVL